MSVVGSEVSTYSAALPTAAGGPSASWSERTGLLLRVRDDTGAIGQGEASPLPGYSRESLQQVHAALEALDVGWLRELTALSSDALLTAIAKSPLVHLPSARFALETALLDVQGQLQGKPLWRLFGEHEPEPVALSTVLPATSDDAALAAAESAWRDGVRTFKVKIAPGRGRPEPFSVLERLRERFGRQCALRLDANRSFEGHSEQLQQLAAFDPDYVEEPQSPARLGHAALPFPVAFDETLSEPEHHARVDAWLRAHPGSVLVLKPMKLGGFAECRRWATRAKGAAARVALSHLFDGPVALWACGQLALSLPQPQLPAGLAPHAGLAAWPEVALPYAAGHISVTRGAGLGLRALPEPHD